MEAVGPVLTAAIVVIVTSLEEDEEVDSAMEVDEERDTEDELSLEGDSLDIGDDDDEERDEGPQEAKRAPAAKRVKILK